MIVDTSALLAYFNGKDPDHDAAEGIVDAAAEELVVSPYILAELDYLITSREGVREGLAALAELAAGAWTLVDFSTDDVRVAMSVIERYANQEIGLADASNVVLAARYRTRTIATLDRRRFDVLRPLNGGRFRVVP